MLIPDCTQSRLAVECVNWALAVDYKKLGSSLQRCYGSLLRESRALSRALPFSQQSTTQGAYDSCLPGAFVSDQIIPGRVVFLDVDALANSFIGASKLDYREDQMGTSRRNFGVAWMCAAIYEHLVRNVGVARKDISLVAPYAAEFFLEKEFLEFL